MRPGQQRCDAFVATLGSHRVLSEIVRADREEVYVSSQRPGQQRGGGDLDHDAGLERRIDAGLRARLVQDLERRSQLGDRRDHREHHLQRMLRGHPQDRPKLCAQQLRFGQLALFSAHGVVSSLM